MAARALFPQEPCDAIMDVMERAFDPVFGEAWNRRQVADALVLGTCRYALIDREGTIGDAVSEPCVGFYLSRTACDEEELLLFAVAPEMRGKGFGRRLLEHFVASAQKRDAVKVFLEMRRGNSAAHLYEQCDFRSVGVRPAYYHGKDGIRRDAVTYALNLRANIQRDRPQE